jgi:hypothetical protein
MAIERHKHLASDYFVYALLADGDDGSGRIKIGYTGNLRRRLRRIQREFPGQIRLMAILGAGNEKHSARKLEGAFHKEFKARRVEGEWFRFDFADEDDKRLFNDGTSRVIYRVLGSRSAWWAKVPINLLDACNDKDRWDFMDKETILTIIRDGRLPRRIAREESVPKSA